MPVVIQNDAAHSVDKHERYPVSLFLNLCEKYRNNEMGA